MSDTYCTLSCLSLGGEADFVCTKQHTGNLGKDKGHNLERDNLENMISSVDQTLIFSAYKSLKYENIGYEKVGGVT